MLGASIAKFKGISSIITSYPFSAIALHSGAYAFASTFAPGYNINPLVASFPFGVKVIFPSTVTSTLLSLTNESSASCPGL